MTAWQLNCTPKVRHKTFGVQFGELNAFIDIMLGKAQASSYLGNANLNNGDKVDMSGLNIVINSMLGKE